MGHQKTPAFKLFLTVIMALMLIVPLLFVYGLVYDRQSQSDTAQESIAAGWGGPQTIVGPVLVIPYMENSVETEVDNKGERTRTIRVKKQLFLAAETNEISTKITPRRKKKSIYESVLYVAQNDGKARFALPKDFARYGIPQDSLLLGEAELRFGVMDARGLQADSKVSVNGESRELQPGKGLKATKDSGFFTFVDWDAQDPLTVEYSYAIRGNKSLTMVPRGGETKWKVASSWPSPSFGGDFLADKPSISDKGFEADYAITNLALGQELVSKNDPEPAIDFPKNGYGSTISSRVDASGNPSQSKAAAISLIEPVNLYSQVDRAVKYGFLFIGFTFLAFFMFDVVAGARVAAAEYLLTGVGLVLFFVMLLAFAEVVGFTIAYLIAAGAISALLTAYSAAILKSWLRARVIGGLLVGLYAVLYTLLNLEAYSLLIGSLMIFVALALVMWATRKIDWSSVGGDNAEADYAEDFAETGGGEERQVATTTSSNS